MLIRLMPEQVSASWDVMRGHIMKAMSPTARTSQTLPLAILKAILAEKAIMWALCSDATGEQINGLILTTHFVDPITDVRSLVMYGAASTNSGVRLTDHDLRDILSTLRKFAIGKGFYNIIAFTTQASLVKLAQRLGARSGVHFVEFGLYEDLDGESVSNGLYINRETSVVEEVVVESAVLVDLEDE